MKCCDLKVPVKYKYFNEKDPVRVCKWCHNYLLPIWEDYKTSLKSLNGEKFSFQVDLNGNSQSSKDKETITNPLESESQQETGSQNKETEDDQNSSSLTDEQMNTIGSFFDENRKGNQTETSEDDLENGIPSNDIENVQERKQSCSKLIEMIESRSSVNNTKILYPRKQFISTKLSNPLIPVQNSQPEIKTRQIPISLFSKSKREPILTDFVYFSKVSFTDSRPSESNENESPNNNQWERLYLALYSDFTIGVCSNQHVNNFL